MKNKVIVGLIALLFNLSVPGLSWAQAAQQQQQSPRTDSNANNQCRLDDRFRAQVQITQPEKNRVEVKKITVVLKIKGDSPPQVVSVSEEKIIKQKGWSMGIGPYHINW